MCEKEKSELDKKIEEASREAAKRANERKIAPEEAEEISKRST